MIILPNGLGNILPVYWSSINKAVTSSLRKGWGHEGPSLLAGIDPAADKPLGRAVWGAVYRATTRKWVVKITTDEREAVAFHDLSTRFKSLRQHPGVVYFADAWQLADKSTTGAGNFKLEYTVYVLLREAVKPLSQTKWKKPGNKRASDMIDALDTIRDLALEYDDGNITRFAPMLKKLAETWEAFPELRHVVDFMRRYFAQSDFALADIHLGNIGIRAGTKDWTIFDLGHPVTVGKPLTEPLFQVLTP